MIHIYLIIFLKLLRSLTNVSQNILIIFGCCCNHFFYFKEKSYNIGMMTYIIHLSRSMLPCRSMAGYDCVKNKNKIQTQYINKLLRITFSYKVREIHIIMHFDTILSKDVLSGSMAISQLWLSSNCINHNYKNTDLLNNYTSYSYTVADPGGSARGARGAAPPPPPPVNFDRSIIFVYLVLPSEILIIRIWQHERSSWNPWTFISDGVMRHNPLRPLHFKILVPPLIILV